MKFFVTGVGGQLGHDVMNELLKRGHEGVGSDIQENYSGVADGSDVTKAPYVSLDITEKEAVEKIISEINPDAVIHCAAWTAVDLAEDEDKQEKVRAINAGGTQNIAEVCKKLDCKMTYISTDYVFDGQGTEPWKPDCKEYAPLNVYGKTKLEVITTPFTFASTTHAIVRNGLIPVFCDIKEDDYTIDTEKLELLINDNTVAIVPVHVYGNMCDVEEIDRIAKKYGLKVIYDAAHAFGVKYKF